MKKRDLKRIVRDTACIRYASDGLVDRWQWPVETLARKAGDCEDLAILRLSMVLAAGGDGYIQRCLSRRTNEHHMVCVCYADTWRGRVKYMLDGPWLERYSDRDYVMTASTYNWDEISQWIETRVVDNA